MRPKGIFPRFSIPEDVDREIRAHVEQRAEELVSEGWEPRAAHEEAIRLFGDREDIARECARVARSHDRADRRAWMMEALWQDVRYGLRTLRRSPGFAAVAVVTLGLGIGANSAIFSVVNGVLLSPLPLEEAQRLTWISELRNRGGTMAVAWPNFVDWQNESTSFQSMTAYGIGGTTILGGDRPISGRVAQVTRDFWRTLRVQPYRGRLTTPEDHVEGGTPVLVASYAFWQNALGGADLDGLVLEARGVRAPVVGIAPPDFDYPIGAELWIPMELFGQSDSRTSHNWSVVGRLADGVAIGAAAEEMDVLTRRIVELEAEADPDFLAVGASVIPLHERIVGDARRPLLLLLGAAGLVLLVACTNLASTLLARGSTRTRELALRVAVGAGRGRIVRQLLTESVVLAGAGAVAGAFVAWGVTRALRALGPTMVPRMESVQVGTEVLLYTGAIACVTALLFGLLPAVRLTGAGADASLAAEARRTAGERQGALWGPLVATEVALALVLLAGSGLLVRSFRALTAEDAGFDASDVVAASISLSRIKYPEEQSHALWYREFLGELEALPGVSAAGVISSVPVGGFIPNGRLELDGDLENHAIAEYVVASEGAFRALDIPLVQGRLFDERDGPDGPHVAIVNSAFVREYWPGVDPIGRQVTGGGMDNYWQERRFAEVVGVVGDVRYQELGREPGPAVYFPYSQRPFRIQFGGTVVVEAASGDAGAVAGGFRSTLQRLDADVPVSISTMQSRVRGSLAEQRFTVLLLGGFSLIALILAGVGIHGVVAYSVSRRTREMGIRLALGADPGRVLRMVMLGSLRTVVLGLVLGLVGALALGDVVRSLLYEVGPYDPVTLAAVVVLLGSVGVLSTWLPARAGTRVDPMVTMRSE